MIEELKDVFELATSLTTLAKEILKLKPNNKNADENYIIIANKKDSAKIGSSGDYAKIGSSGDYAQIGSSGDYAQIGSSGYYAQIGSSGDSAQIGSSGDSAQIGSSGDYAKINSTGNDAVVAGIGYRTIIKAKKGSWITLAEYDPNDNYKPVCVKSAQIDGEELKTDTYYILLDKKFQECVYIDGIISIVISKHENVYKVRNLGEIQESFIVQDGDVYSHGSTIQEAKDSLIYKISNRDTSKFDNYTLETELTLKEAIEMYRVIAGACEGGTRYFVENILTDKKDKYTVQEVITLTQGQYNHEKLVEFFKA